MKKLHGLAIGVLLSFLTLSACSSPKKESEQESITPKEELVVSTSKTSFCYSDKLNIADFEVKDKDGNTIQSSSITIEDYDAYNNKEQKVKFVAENQNYGYYTLKLTPLESFKVLLISNSHGEDVMHYVHELASSAGLTDFRFVNMFMAGAQMAHHASNCESDFDGYQFQDYKGGDAEITLGVSIRQACEADNWDFILVQQLSGNSRKPSFIKDMNTVIDYCKEHCANKDVKILYNMPFAYANMPPETIVEQFWDGSSLKMYENIAEVTKDYVAVEPRIEAVIPTGTAAQNAAAVLTDEGTHRDALHMNDIGRFVIGHSFVSKICGVPVDSLTFKGTYNDDMKALAVKAAQKALDNPYEVSDMA